MLEKLGLLTFSFLHFSKDIAKVNIFYEQLDYYSWDESPEYNVSWEERFLFHVYTLCQEENNV